MKASRHHSNRRAHNWLAYKTNDALLEKYAPLYRGVLYDFGCGESPYRAFFLQYAERYVGVDWAGSPHDTRADIAADLNEPIPIDSEVADTIVSLSVLEHLREPGRMLSEAFRILKPNGALILQVPWQWRIHEAPHDYFRYTPFGLRYLLQKAGFARIEVVPQSGFFTMLVLKLNYFSNRLVRGPLPVRWLTRALLWPFWTLGQWVAPTLDKLDRHRTAESIGYFVTASKP